MAPEQRYNVMITLSEMAYKEMEEVARSKGLPLATHLRMILEQHHESPAYGSMVRRAKKRLGQEMDEPDSYKYGQQEDEAQ